jgi:hypothetical protein
MRADSFKRPHEPEAQSVGHAASVASRGTSPTSSGASPLGRQRWSGWLVGAYWDDAWHTDRGRDSLFVAPHLVLYAGVLMATVPVAMLARKPWSPAHRLALAGGAAVRRRS